MYTVNSVSLTFQFQQFATRVLTILHTTFTPHYETKVAHYQFSLSRTPPRIMTTSLIMVLPPVFVTSFLHEAIVIITIIFEIMILISQFPNLRKNFLRGVSGYVSYEAKTAQSIHSFKGLILININVIMWFVGVHN